MLKARVKDFYFSGKFSVFVILPEHHKIRKISRKFRPITMHIGVFCFLFSAALKPLTRKG
jgi:hypothetical protein